ncbi:MAG: hypothetical protein JXA30_06710 [Deltaproteobacteria bacterium]|nr:hypothetical protein [Deltaproteobacteria bacterium]
MRDHSITRNEPVPYSTGQPLVPAWRLLWNVRRATLLIFLFRSAFALSLSLPAADLVDISSYRHPQASPIPGGDALLLVEIVREALPALRQKALIGIGIVLLYLLLVPYLSMLWLCALDRPGPIQNSGIEASRRYHASFLLSLLFLFAIALSISASFCLYRLLQQALWSGCIDAVRDLISLAFLLPGSLLTLFLFVLHDLSRAALCSEKRILNAIRLGMRATFRPPNIASYLYWFGLAALLTLVSALVMLFLDSGPTRSCLTLFILLQITALGRTALRGRWWISALRFIRDQKRPNSASFRP